MSLFAPFLEDLDIWWVVANCIASLRHVLIGISIAIPAGILCGLLRSSLPARVKRNLLVRFLCEAPKFPPPIAWIPFVILLFGIGEAAAAAIVFVGAFSPVFTSTYEGAESVSPLMRDTAMSFEVRGIGYLFRIIFMAALPDIFTGAKIGLSMGWMSVVAAEMISGQSGLGYAIQADRMNLRYDLVLLDIILIGLIGFMLAEAAARLERLLLPWHQKTRR